MKWKMKAFIQNMIARLPYHPSHACYYALQRATGSFRHPRVDSYFGMVRALSHHIERQGGQISGATFLEVGTGRCLTLPVLLWCMGAQRIITVDLHRYVRKSIVELDLRTLIADAARMDGAGAFQPDRLQALQGLLASEWDLPMLAKLCSIDYRAPANAARLDLPAACIDYHISFTVFEHIPGPVIKNILLEAGRLLRPSGLCIHLVDHSDHFSHSDPSISAINFLQYEDADWARLADNPYMYMNRLRADDYPALYASAFHDIHLMESTKELSLLAELSSPTFQLASRFREKSSDTLVTTHSWIVSSHH